MAIYILTIVIVIVLPIEAFVTAVKLVAVGKFMVPETVMASMANVAPVALMRVVVIVTLAAVWPL